MNVVRSGFHWHRGEPTPGHYNYTYIQQIVDFVDLLNHSGVYVILDMHQDCWSPRFCGNHGIPTNYAKPYNDSRYSPGGSRTYPEPIVKPKYNALGHITNCNDVGKFVFRWASCYFTYALGSAAQELYNNDRGLLDQFGKFWALIAEKISHYPNVLGYELINEPWLGDVPLSISELNPENPYWDLWFPKEADKTNIAGMYRELHNYIRHVDNDTIIFFEPATGGNFLDAWPTGFESGPGGPEYNDRQALSYHVYCLVVDTNNASGFIQWLVQQLDIASCNALNDVMYNIRHDDTKRLGVPGFLTEFGNAGKGVADKAIVDFATGKMDDFLHGWTYWYLTPDRKDANTSEVRALTRPYPHIVSGIPIKLTFDPNKHIFELQWSQCTKLPCANKPTEIYTSEWYHYVGGFQYSIIPKTGYNVTHDSNTSMIYILPENGHTSAETVKFTIFPK